MANIGVVQRSSLVRQIKQLMNDNPYGLYGILFRYPGLYS
jgi:hypothetical protein